MKALYEIILRACWEIANCKASVETIASGREVPRLQGKIAGFKELILKISEHWADDLEILNMITDIGSRDVLAEQIVKIEDMSDDDLFLLYSSVEELIETDKWAALLRDVTVETEEMKTYLLIEAKKTRELDVYQGKYEGLTMYEKLCANLDAERERRQAEKKGSLFEDQGLDTGLVPPLFLSKAR